MSAYVIVDVTIHKPERYEEYKRMATTSVEEYDGRYVVRGGRVEVLEGDVHPNRVVVLEFPTYERAKEWWASDAYAPGKALRQEIATTTMIVVEGH